MTRHLTRAALLVLAGFVLAGSCRLTDGGADVATEGTISLRPIEGGCWVIETASETYEPVSLPAKHREDGLRVRFSAEVKENAVSFCMVGPVIEIREIEPVE